jgi:hypothetical protein
MARYYNGAQGRFSIRDLIYDINLFTYVENIPVRNIVETGESFKALWKSPVKTYYAKKDADKARDKARKKFSNIVNNGDMDDELDAFRHCRCIFGSKSFLVFR